MDFFLSRPELSSKLVPMYMVDFPKWDTKFDDKFILKIDVKYQFFIRINLRISRFVSI